MKLYRITLFCLLSSFFIVAFGVTHDKAATKVETKASSTKSAKTVLHLRDQLTQDEDNPAPKYYWFDDHVGVSGLLSVDLRDQTHPNFTQPRSDTVSLGQAKVNLIGKVNDWVKARLGLFYSTNSSYYYAAANTKKNVDVDDAYIDIGNLNKKPFYLRAGLQYLPFGKYHRYPILQTLTQQLSETRAVAVQVGLADTSGLYGAVYGFNGARKMTQRHTMINDGGFAVGYENLNHELGVNVGASYINNFADVGAIQNNLSMNRYQSRVAGASAHLDLLYGPFDIIGRYVTALSTFATTDFAYMNAKGLHGAKPSAATVSAGYQFKLKGRDSKAVVSYQWTNQAYNANGAGSALQMPKNRISVGYGINVLKNTILAFEYDRDHDYARAQGGTNGYNNTATIRLTVLV